MQYQALASTSGEGPVTTVRTGTGSTLMADAPHEGQEHPGPMELLVASIASCKTMTVQIYAGRKGWGLDRVEVRTTLVRAEGAGTRDEIRSVIRLEGDLDADQRSRLVDVAGKCPVARLVAGGVAIADEAG